jgi:hypothetical protein
MNTTKPTKKTLSPYLKQKKANQKLILKKSRIINKRDNLSEEQKKLDERAKKIEDMRAKNKLEQDAFFKKNSILFYV